MLPDNSHYFSGYGPLLKSSLYCFCFTFWFFWLQGILAPQLGAEPAPLAMESEVNPWTTREVRLELGFYHLLLSLLVPIGLALQRYTKGNLARICLGAIILILLVGLLAEDWHSRRKPLMMHRIRAAHRPLPPLPQTQKPQGRQDRGRPDGYNRGFNH